MPHSSAEVRRSPWSTSAATLLLACLATLRAAAAPAAADPPAGDNPKYALRLLVQAGQAWAFSSSTATDLTVRAASNGQPVQNTQTVATQRRAGTITLKAVRDGVPSAAVVAFAKDCADVSKVNGEEQTEAWPLAGKTVTLQRAADGRVTNDAEGLDPALAAEVGQLLEMDRSMYPRDPVAVGDGWAPDTAKLRQQFQLSADDKLSVRCKLTGVVQVRGRRAYDVNVTGTIDKADDGVNLRMEVGGSMRYDVATGVPLQGSLSARVTLKGEQQAPGPNGPVAVSLTGGGTVTMTQNATLGDAAALANANADGGPAGPGAPAGPATPVGPIGPVGPVAGPPVRPGGGDADRGPTNRPTPPRPANPASPFTGLFKGDELAADLEVDAGGRVTGSITKAGKQYRLTGTVRDGRVLGAFEASGVEFNFAAALDGDTLTFETEGSRYVMRKR